MWARLVAWWRGGAVPETRLTADAARAVANAAMTGDWAHYAGRMTVAAAELRDGRAVWQVGSATIGSGVFVIIDDATGEVLERRSWGLR